MGEAAPKPQPTGGEDIEAQVRLLNEQIAAAAGKNEPVAELQARRNELLAKMGQETGAIEGETSESGKLKNRLTSVRALLLKATPGSEDFNRLKAERDHLTAKLDQLFSEKYERK